MKTMEFKNAPEILTIEGPFNTFRLGRKWDAVARESWRTMFEDAAVDTLVDEVPGPRLRLVDVFTGPLQEMLQQHAGRNHAVQNIGPGNGADFYALEQILMETYGPDKVSPEEVYTVVYLQRI